MNLSPNPTKIDVSQAFLVFMSLVGDVDKTASALDIPPAVIQELADREGWVEKVRRLSVLSKSEKPGDYEKAINRALNIMQAHQVRGVLARIISELAARSTDELLNGIVLDNRNLRPVVTSKFFYDLAGAMEKIQNLTYVALGDTLGERNARLEQDGSSVSADAIHASVINALNSAGASQLTPEEVIVKAHVDIVKKLPPQS